jgi:hypothetical protein
VAAVAVLEQLGVVDADDARFLGFARPVLKNVAGLEVGELRAAFELQMLEA